MPSFFVQFGIIYASLLVPAANAAKANHRALDVRLELTCENQVRWAKYFCVYSVVSFFLKLLESYLYYIPFVTHAKLVLFMWLALPGFGACDAVFGMILTEAAALGEALGIGEGGGAEGGERAETLFARGGRIVRSIGEVGKVIGEAGKVEKKTGKKAIVEEEVEEEEKGEEKEKEEEKGGRGEDEKEKEEHFDVKGGEDKKND